MQLQEITELYNQGAFDQVLEVSAVYLQREPQDSQAWCLRGKCNYQLGRLAETAEDANRFFEAAFEDLSRALSINPGYSDALLFRLFTAAYCLPEREAEAMADSETLLAANDPSLALKALLYRFPVQAQHNNGEDALADMQRALDLAAELYREELPVYNYHASECYTNMGDVWQAREDHRQALYCFREAFRCNFYHQRSLEIAHLALDCADYDFAAEVIKGLFTPANGDQVQLTNLLMKVKALLDDGLEHAQLAAEYAWGSLNFFEDIYGHDDHDGSLEQISTGKRFIAQYPGHPYFYQFTAGAFFFMRSYAEALPYLEKCIAIRPYPMTILRWCFATYATTGSFPATWPDVDYPFPYNWYEAGCMAEELRERVNDKAAEQQLILLKRYLYEKAYRLYHGYWRGNTGSSSAGDRHHFAMCCNNYGITLYETGEYEQAIAVHTTGFEMSPFWEQLASRADSLQELGRLEEAIKDRVQIVEQFAGYLTPVYYVTAHARIIEHYTDLKQYPEALHWYNKILKEHADWLGADIASQQLSAKELEDIEYNLDRIKTMRAFIKSGDDDLHERIHALEQHLVEKPDDTDAYFNLMFLYFDAAEYRQCVAVINNRLALGGLDKIPAESHMKLYYFRGKAFQQLGNYAESIRDLGKTLQMIEEGDDEENKPSDLQSVYRQLSQVHLAAGQFAESIRYAQKCVAIYDQQRWAWDENRSGIQYTLVCALEGAARISEARQALALLLNNDPMHEEGLEKKKQLKGNGFFSFFKK